MPVKKNGTSMEGGMEMPTTKSPMSHHGCCGSSCGGGCYSFGKKLGMTLLGIFVAYMIVFVGVLIRNEMKKYDYIGRADKAERMMSIQGEGKVIVKPDVAVTSLGMISVAPTVADAQKKNTDIMNNLISKLKALKIDEKDIQTSAYNIYPQYNYSESEGQTLKGYEVSQSVTVKIRDLTKANQVIALAGEVGINDVGGLQFTVDDRDVYLEQARQLALAKVADKMAVLSKELGVRLTSVISYDEYETGQTPDYSSYAKLGMGGSDLAPAAPQLESGSNEIVMKVNVTFEIR